ncbi:DUF3568 family protein [Francisella tularensis subsp. novicida]|uniref:DUF3568 family protein n=2 Tax=Francisella tularensis TaxID=263 RepID=A0A6I4RUM8_FRATU|nr:MULTISPECIES: DUF3568 family protein [Francisella]ABK90252.1 protein of unknown function [Francisella tularensis subsp. novicida U112]AJI45748.1 hypothetical protein AS84_1128 [Francisella tularensis subsp. novicida F6168]AJI60726.1 hypothetical protein AW25_620 [Francisella tularensis subsp. novicida U112]AJJ48248.1 hypothetical protein CH70_558 [Francisella tularensis subsp. novicida]APA83551.1 hypothetical protein N894_1567 [Francisella tularensis subsp. novicida PA10-7858]
MKGLKAKIYIIFLAAVLAVISGCATDKGTQYEDGYYITTLNYNFNTVYNATLQAIQNGQTFDYKGNPYDISVNKNNGTDAEIVSASDSDSTDSLQVAMKKLPNNATRISIKYGSQGNSIRSSALIGIIEGNIRYANT